MISGRTVLCTATAAAATTAAAAAALAPTAYADRSPKTSASWQLTETTDESGGSDAETQTLQPKQRRGAPSTRRDNIVPKETTADPGGTPFALGSEGPTSVIHLGHGLKRAPPLATGDAEWDATCKREVAAQRRRVLNRTSAQCVLCLQERTPLLPLPGGGCTHPVMCKACSSVQTRKCNEDPEFAEQLQAMCSECCAARA